MAESIQTIPTGAKYRRNGTIQRAQCIDVTFRGTTMRVEYTIEGSELAATATDPAERPMIEVAGVQIGGVEVWHFLGDSYVGEEIREAVEHAVLS